MDIKLVTDLISDLGFPIFVCLVLFWFIKNYLDKFITSLNEFNLNLQQNTVSLEKLAEKIDGVNKNV